MQMHFQLVRLDALLRDITIRLQSRNNDFSYNLAVPKGGLAIQADPARLTQVVENMLNNALKYAPGSEITLHLERAGNWAHVSVSDHGPGIPPEHLGRLFERFYRVPSQTGEVRGTGLGLYICRQIVEAHGGKISVESELGKGSTFHIYLPCS
jgi:signal transduction histidine kinase